MQENNSTVLNKPLSSLSQYNNAKKKQRIPDNQINLWSADKRARGQTAKKDGVQSVTLENEDYGEEEKFIKSVEDDVLDNKYSSDGDHLSPDQAQMMKHLEPPFQTKEEKNSEGTTIKSNYEIKSSRRVNSTVVQALQENKSFRQHMRSKLKSKINNKYATATKESSLGHQVSDRQSTSQGLNSRQGSRYQQILHTTVSKQKENCVYNSDLGSKSRRGEKDNKSNEGSMVIARQIEYFKEKVKPLHEKQRTKKKIRENFYQRLIKRQALKTKEVHSNNQNESALYSLNQSFGSKSMLRQKSSNDHLIDESKVKGMKMSNYFQPQKVRCTSSNAYTIQAKRTNHTNVHTSFDTLDNQMSIGNYQRGMNENSQGIFYQDARSLRQNHVNAKQAYQYMQNFKAANSTNDSFEYEKPIQVCVNDQVLDPEQIEKLNKQRNSEQTQWKEFLYFMAKNPKQLLEVVPSPKENVNNKGGIQINDQQTLSHNFSVQLSQFQRPNSSHNHASIIIKKQMRLLKEAEENENRKQYAQYNDSTSLSNYNRRIRASKVQQRPKSQLEKNGVVNNSQGSTQYTFKIGESTPFSKKNDNKVNFYSSNPEYKTIEESNNEASPQKEKEGGPHRSQSVLKQAMQETKIPTFNQPHIPQIQQFQTQEFNSYLKIPVNPLIENFKYPIGHYLAKVQHHQSNSNYQLDTSTYSLQQKSKTRISAYQRANQKLKRIEQIKESRKPKFSLAKELGGKMKIDEWKKDASVHQFKREVNSQSPMRNGKIIDWKFSVIKSLLDQKKALFNCEGDRSYFKADEVDYFMQIFKYSPKTFANIEQLKPVFEKALITLKKVMEELMLGHLYDRIQLKIVDITPENTLRLFVRIKLMLKCRDDIINILRIIEEREMMLKELNYFVIQGGLQNNNKNEKDVKEMRRLKLEREGILKEKIKQLNQITEIFVLRVRELYSLRKVFGRVFIYDNMDYIKVVINEVKQLKEMLKMFGLDLNNDLNLDYAQKGSTFEIDSIDPYNDKEMSLVSLQGESIK